MGKYEFKLGAYMDLLDKNELAEALEKQTEMLTAYARGVKHLSFTAQGTIAGGSVSIPGPVSGVGIAQLQQPILGPSDGFVWALQRATIDGITASSDVVTIYKNVVTGNNHLFSLGSPPNEVRFPGGHAIILLGGDQLVASGTGLTSTGTLTLTGEAFAVPSEMISKLIV